jgi:hypothetical protein
VQLTKSVNHLKGTRTYTAITTMKHQVALTSLAHCYDYGDSNSCSPSQRCLRSSEPRRTHFLRPSGSDQAMGFIRKYLHARTGTSFSISVSRVKLKRSKTPAGDVPIRSVTLASDGSCLVAGNNKVANSARLPRDKSVRMTPFSRASVMYGKSTKRVQGYPVFKPSRNFRPTTSI